MTKRTKMIIAFVLILQMVLPYPLYAATVGKFTSVVGNVVLTRDGKDYRPVVNSAVNEKDLIVTGDGASAVMVFTDDSTITLSPKTRMQVREFGMEGKARKGIFSLSIGKLVANVTKFIGGNNKFEVHSPTAVCGVRGTLFGLEVAMVGTVMTTTATCTTGALSVSALSATGAIVATSGIVAGQTAVITSTGITVGAAGAAGAAGAGAAGSAGTTGAAGAGAAGTTGAAAGTAGAGAAGAAGGAAAAAGVGAGTIATAAAVAAAAVAAAVAATGGTSDTTPTHTTPVHH
ncbi:MAG TPA: FecR family protein [Smithellaceae bacterium]|nr:FecR family protein [Smithellaceae bacterium]HQG99449.1 FecR family protein [Smithellaceae bacterium]HQH04374.1 FecR family protein [Smithellaceae bacterium]HQJ78543.1 FecR family protein [Smithellaceae bacterium]